MQQNLLTVGICHKIKLQYAIGILQYIITALLHGVISSQITHLDCMEVDRQSSYSDQSDIRSQESFVYLQQPVDTGALSRLRSTPCERGTVDAPGSVLGNFFAVDNAHQAVHQSNSHNNRYNDVYSAAILALPLSEFVLFSSYIKTVPGSCIPLHQAERPEPQYLCKLAATGLH